MVQQVDGSEGSEGLERRTKEGMRLGFHHERWARGNLRGVLSLSQSGCPE